MKKTLIASVVLLAYATVAQAQSAYEQVQDAASDGAYAAGSDSSSDEDSSDNAGAVFDGTPTSGTIEDPTSLQPGGLVVTPNSD